MDTKTFTGAVLATLLTAELLNNSDKELHTHHESYLPVQTSIIPTYVYGNLKVNSLQETHSVLLFL